MKQAERPSDKKTDDNQPDADEAQWNSTWAKRFIEKVHANTNPVWETFSPDLAERSREILNAEFADYIRRKMPLDDEIQE